MNVVREARLWWTHQKNDEHLTSVYILLHVIFPAELVTSAYTSFKETSIGGYLGRQAHGSLFHAAGYLHEVCNRHGCFGPLLSRHARRSRLSYPPHVALHWWWNQKSILGGLASMSQIPLNIHPPVTAYSTHTQVICSWYRTSMTARSCCRPKRIRPSRCGEQRVMRDPSWSPAVRSHCGRLMFLR